MFEAGSDFKNRTPEQILNQDYKIFENDDVKFGVAQVSSISKAQLDSIKAGIIEYMNNLLDSSDLNAIYVMLTDILNQSTELLYVGNDAGRIISDAFLIPIQEGSFTLPGVVSRKKQLIPPIMESLQN